MCTGCIKTHCLSVPADHAVMMIPEPENKHDEHAIAVTNMAGQMLGYVPKDINRDREFKGGVLFGYVSSIGPVPDKPHIKGFKVISQDCSFPGSLHSKSAPELHAPSLKSSE